MLAPLRTGSRISNVVPPRPLRQLISLERIFAEELTAPDIVVRWFARGADREWILKRETDLWNLMKRDLALWNSDPSAHPAIERRVTALFRRRSRFAMAMVQENPSVMHRHIMKMLMPALPEEGGSEVHPTHAPFRAVRVS